MKRLSVCLVALLVCCTLFAALPAFAEAPANVAPGIQPRWAELGTFRCSLERKIGLFTNAYVYSSASTDSAYSTINMTVTIQEWNGSEYVDTSHTWSSSGNGSTSVSKNVKLPEGSYRAKSVVTVYSSSGQYIETITIYSGDIII